MTSGDVNDYLREVSGGDFTAKDFRTWAGTVFVAETLLAEAEPASVAAGRRAVLAAIDAAAERLGNTRDGVQGVVCPPGGAGRLHRGLDPRALPARAAGRLPRGLDAAEQATLRILLAAARPRSLARRTPARRAA